MGEKKGLEEGRKAERKQGILALLSKGLSKDFILELGYSEKEILDAQMM